MNVGCGTDSGEVMTGFAPHAGDGGREVGVMVARALHQLSPRRERRFCDVNCAALPDELLESELFGHTRGAFTGAVADRPGLVEEADTGTLFLDEVSDLSARAQAKLLRVLQQQEVRRVGATVSRQVDVRVISAANRDLRVEAAAGRFRQDLRGLTKSQSISAKGSVIDAGEALGSFTACVLAPSRARPSCDRSKRVQNSRSRPHGLVPWMGDIAPIEPERRDSCGAESYMSRVPERAVIQRVHCHRAVVAPSLRCNGESKVALRDGTVQDHLLAL
jgi:hypothetical protein